MWLKCHSLNIGWDFNEQSMRELWCALELWTEEKDAFWRPGLRKGKVSLWRSVWNSWAQTCSPSAVLPAGILLCWCGKCRAGAGMVESQGGVLSYTSVLRRVGRPAAGVTCSVQLPHHGQWVCFLAAFVFSETWSMCVSREGSAAARWSLW